MNVSGVPSRYIRTVTGKSETIDSSVGLVPTNAHEHAMSFARQVGESEKCGGAHAIIRIRNVVPDYDHIHRYLQQYFGAKETSWDRS